MNQGQGPSWWAGSATRSAGGPRRPGHLQAHTQTGFVLRLPLTPTPATYHCRLAVGLQRRLLSPGVRLPCSVPSHKWGDGVWGLGDPLCSSGFLRIPVFKGEETGWSWASSLRSPCLPWFSSPSVRRMVASPGCCDEMSQAWAVGPDFLTSLHSSDD